MPHRTKKDVRTFARSSSYKPSDDSEYGYVKISGLDSERIGRFREHNWITTTNELTNTGKCIILRWESMDSPADALKEEGSGDFIEKAVQTHNPKSHVDDRQFRGLDVLDNPDHPKVPAGFDSYIESDYIGDMSRLDVACQAIKNGNHLALKGEAGTAKTYMANHIGQMREQPVYQMNFSKEVRIQHLLGHYEVYSDGDGGTDMEWIDGELTECVKEGGIFIANEGNMVDGAILSALNSIIEKNNPTLTIPEKGETIDVHPEFRLVITMNPRYSGSKKLNRATSSRFQHIKFEYPTKTDEKKIVKSQMDTSGINTELGRVIDAVQELRDDYKSGEISEPITPRETIRIMEYIKDGFLPPAEATKLGIVGKIQPENETAVEKVIEKVF